MAYSSLYKPILFFFSIIVAVGIFIISFNFLYAHKVAPGVRISNVAVGGLTQAELNSLLRSMVGKYLTDGVVFLYGERMVTISPVQQDTSNIELSREIFNMNLSELADRAYYFAKDGNFFSNTIDKIRSAVFHTNFYPQYTLDEEALEELLKDEFSDFEIPAQDAFLVYDAQRNVFTLEKEIVGRIFDYQAAISAFKKDFIRLQYRPQRLFLIKDFAQKKRGDLIPIMDKANALIDQLPIEFFFEDLSWEVGQDEFGTWLISHDGKNGVELDIDENATEEFFSAIHKKVDVPVQNAKFAIVDGKVSEFQVSSSGKQLNTDKTLNNLRAMLRSGKLKPIELVMEEVKPEITNEKVNDLGIKELLGTGHSNFAGSPKNRQHNIRVGSDSVNGTLVAPGEEFSLVDTLGAIDANTGYLPELVIKGNKTIPEYGGGLCQVGTTIFRAAMEAGLPITERRNHSYNVSYYLENGLPGTDATIYPPHPDVRFLNDTGNYILVQTRMEGNDLYYEIWGTKDGRSASRTTPEIWDKIAPPPTKLINTTDLKPGEKKCTESAHDGLKARFNYTIIYADGTKKEKTFYSIYRPWQEVCLVGVEKVEESSVSS